MLKSIYGLIAIHIKTRSEIKIVKFELNIFLYYQCWKNILIVHKLNIGIVILLVPIKKGFALS